MRKRLLGVIGLATLALAHSSKAETVSQSSIAFTLKYQDGSTENYVAHYKGIVDSNIWESGEPAKPLQGHFIDDRQCHLEINQHIDRQVCQVSRAFG